MAVRRQRFGNYSARMPALAALLAAAAAACVVGVGRGVTVAAAAFSSTTGTLHRPIATRSVSVPTTTRASSSSSRRSSTGSRRLPFLIATVVRASVRASSSSLSSSSQEQPPPPPGGDNTDTNDTITEEPTLHLESTDLQQQMARLQSKYPTSEASYLAAARARSAAKLASNNEGSTDQEWRELAAAKRQQHMGSDSNSSDDGWESSRTDAAGASESQILWAMPNSSTSADGGEDEEPKLLLF